MIYDFESGYSEKTEKPQIVRKDSALDAIQRKLYEALEKEKSVRVFTMQDAKLYFLQMREKNPAAYKCLVHIESSGQGHEIIQILLGESGEPLYSTSKEVYGRKLRADALEQAVVDRLAGRTGFIMECGKPEEAL
ncbi:MAG: hypothetical protein Q4C58_07245 [Eubacteriales bacterium]|nr:hypothetical protein [Eubacteriales bacterium]